MYNVSPEDNEAVDNGDSIYHIITVMVVIYGLFPKSFEIRYI